MCPLLHPKLKVHQIIEKDQEQRKEVIGREGSGCHSVMFSPGMAVFGGFPPFFGIFIPLTLG
jgi:hypothetical protein